MIYIHQGMSMKKQNCWEFKKCGRQPGGARESELGTCPAPLEAAADGLNNGKNGGRACWALAGTLCGNKVQGTFASKLANCLQCDFYQSVMREEGGEFVKAKDILERLEQIKHEQS